jgi:hypothetical protein
MTARKQRLDRDLLFKDDRSRCRVCDLKHATPPLNDSATAFAAKFTL